MTTSALPYKQTTTVPTFHQDVKLSRWLLLFTLHAALGPATYFIPNVAGLHNFVTAVLALVVTLLFPGSYRSMYLIFYILGNEVFWRMSGHGLTWEIAKFLIILITMGSVLQKRIRRPIHWIYLACFIPSAVYFADLSNMNELRKTLSFTLSGQICLGFCLLYFDRKPIPWNVLKKAMLFAIAPTISISTYAALYGVNSKEVTFSDASNFITSGGYGPNQVASILALSAIFSFWVFLTTSKNKRRMQIFMLFLSIVFMVHAVITFSRTGVYLIGLTLAAASPLLLTSQALRKKARVFMVILLFAGLLIAPYLVSLTEGAIYQRYKNTSTTGRTELILEEFRLFINNPILGVGPGNSFESRRQFSEVNILASHTEFTRILSEHGMFGLVALIMLGMGLFVKFHQHRTNTAKLTFLMLVAFSILYQLSSAMRTAIPAVTLALAFAALGRVPKRTLKLSAEEEEEDHSDPILRGPAPTRT